MIVPLAPKFCGPSDPKLGAATGGIVNGLREARSLELTRRSLVFRLARIDRGRPQMVNLGSGKWRGSSGLITYRCA